MLQRNSVVWAEMHFIATGMSNYTEANLEKKRNILQLNRRKQWYVYLQWWVINRFLSLVVFWG